MNTLHFIGLFILRLLMALIIFFTTVQAQENSIFPEIKIKDHGALKFHASSQLWLRYTPLNDGSTISDKPTENVTDLSVRRFRLALGGDITKRWFFKAQVGMNNVNFTDKKAYLKLLDLLVVYRFSDQFNLGLGKTAYTGPSRYASVASSSMLGADVPIFALSTINISDDLLRKWSVFMKGDWGKLNYRMVFSYPKIIEKEDPISTFASFKNGNPRFQTSGYVKYQFLDKDNGKSAFMPGTFLGTKKVITLGVGFLHQQEATWSLSNLDTLQHDILEFAIDLFVDIPLSYPVRTAITFYGGYFHTDFGPNYLRNIGVNNPANGNDGSTVNGTGNAYPAIGTGKVCYTQLGYYIALTKPLLMIEAVQPYFNLQYADYEKLDQNMILIESGLSLLFNGHQSKLTLGIQNRPIYIRTPADQLKVGNRKNMCVIQYQFKLK